MKFITVLFSVCMAGSAFANKPAPPIKVDIDQNQSVRNSVSIYDSQKQNQRQGQEQGQGQDQSQSANNEGNTLSVLTESVRQAPATAQGSFAIAGCSVAGNGGGSRTGGSAFLGFGFMSAECYKYLTAQAYQALGQYETACLILNQTRAAKMAVKAGVALPTCDYAKPLPAAAPSIDTSQFVTKAELAKSQEALVKAVVSK